MDHLIDLNNKEWDIIKDGYKEKFIVKDEKKIRIIHFDNGFSEKEWCFNSHFGYIIEGELQINFNGQLKQFTKGNCLSITKDPANKHKVEMASDKDAVIILFELLTK